MPAPGTVGRDDSHTERAGQFCDTQTDTPATDDAHGSIAGLSAIREANPGGMVNFRALRLLGITARKTIDTVIATRCIESRLALLYSDRDFDPFVEHLGLRSAMQ